MEESGEDQCTEVLCCEKTENVQVKWEKGEAYKKIEQPFYHNAIGVC